MSSLRNSRCAPNPRRTDRGSAVITVLVLAAVTAVIASSFLFRSAQEAKLANRSYYQSVALNLAEAGIEEGLYAANSTALNAGNGWTLISGTAADYSKSIASGLTFAQATGAIHIRVDNSNTLTPTIIAAGVVTIPNQPTITKQLRIVGAKRHLWANGLVVKQTLTFSGTTTVDSYNSALGAYNSVTNRSDLATVATLSTALDPIVLGSNTSIYGYVSTGGADPLVGSGGRIYGATTPSGTLVDQTRIRRDFTANLPDATASTVTAVSLGSVVASVTLPRAGDTVSSNGRYVYTMTQINLGGSSTISVLGPVDIIVTGTVATAGNAALSIGGAGSTNPSLNLYAAGNVSLAGNALLNQTSDAGKVTIWGTAAVAANQTIAVSGNGAYTGTVYAPNATVTMAGMGGTYGAIIAKTATVGGNGQFHYDTQLGSLLTTLDVSFRPTTWAELNAAPGSGAAFARDNRAPFASLF